MPVSPPVKLEIFDDHPAINTSESPIPLFNAASQARRRAAWVYVAGGLAFALTMSIALLLTSNSFSLSAFLWGMVAYTWPTVFVIALLTATRRRDVVWVVGGYFAALSTAALIGLVRNPDLSFNDLLWVWLPFNGVGSLLLLAFLHRRIRAIGPAAPAVRLLDIRKVSRQTLQTLFALLTD